jgi:biopolymer transport protein ExbD
MRAGALTVVMATAFAALLCGCSPAPVTTPPKPVVVVVRFVENGTVLWNGTAVDSATLDRLLDNAAHQTPPPQIHLEPDRRTDYAVIAKFLAAAQRKGVSHLGFTGIETMP